MYCFPKHQVHLGFLRYNDHYEDYMVDLLEWIHSYVTGHDKKNTGDFSVKTLNGGDYLTYEHHQGKQSSMQDAWTPSVQLCGLLGELEDLHTQYNGLR